MYREESQGSLGRKPADVSLTGRVNSLETLQCECVAQTRKRHEPSSIQVPSRGALAWPGWCAAAAWHCAPAAATLVPQQQLNFGWAVSSVLGPRWGTMLPSSSTTGASGTPVLPWLGSGSSAHMKGTVFACCPPNWPMSWPPITRCERPGCHAATPASPLGLISPASHVLRWGRLSLPLFGFLTFSEESSCGSQHLQNLINAERYQGMRLLWEAEQMC